MSPPSGEEKKKHMQNSHVIRVFSVKLIQQI